MLLRLLSVITVVVLRYGSLPLGVMVRLGALLARADDRLGFNKNLLDQLSDEILADFGPERRAELDAYLADVARDSALIPELTPAAMAVFNAACPDSPEVRYGCVVGRARPPGIAARIEHGLEPYAQFSATLYEVLYRLSERMPPEALPVPTPAQEDALRAVYTDLPAPGANDGIVPTGSQLWGEPVHVARADHLDTIGHFHQPGHQPPHYDWLITGTGFGRYDFEALWSDVARWILGSIKA
jgi:hypothetical protein